MPEVFYNLYAVSGDPRHLELGDLFIMTQFWTHWHKKLINWEERTQIPKYPNNWRSQRLWINGREKQTRHCWVFLAGRSSRIIRMLPEAIETAKLLDSREISTRLGENKLKLAIPIICWN
jgi:hypothetical protein